MGEVQAGRWDDQVRMSPGHPQLCPGESDLVILLPGPASCQRKSGGFCCPAPPGAAGFRFCCPVRSGPRFHFITLTVRSQLRGNRERLVVVGTYRFERFYGAFRPGKEFRLSTHVDPSSAPSAEPLGRHACVLALRVMWWSRRVLPPGPLRLFHGIVYRHSRQAGADRYRRTGVNRK